MEGRKCHCPKGQPAAGRRDKDQKGDGDREGEGEEEGSASRVLPWELLSVGKSGGSVE